MAVDTSVKAWLKETGAKSFFRTKVLGIGLGKKKEVGYNDLKDSGKSEYNKWKAVKNAEEARKRQSEENKQKLNSQLEQFDKQVSTILTTVSARELQNKRLLEEIQKINSVDLSIDTSNYIGNNEIESKYPGLVESIFSQIETYGNSFKEEEEYAEVVVTNTINTKEEVLNHIRWMIIKPSSILDVELRNVEDMGSWVLQTTENVGLRPDGNSGSILGVKNIEKPKSIPPKELLEPIKIPILEIKKDAKILTDTKLFLERFK